MIFVKYRGSARHLAKRTALIIAALIFLCAPSVSAKGYGDLSASQLEQLGIYFVKGDFTCGATSTLNGSVSSGNAELHLSAKQVEIAKVIIGIAKTYNLGEKGAIVGLLVALAESHLRMYASDVIPESKTNPAWRSLPDGDRVSGHDHDSVGVYQQRVSSGWSTFGNYDSSNDTVRQKIVYQLMDPAYSAQAFFGTPPGANLPTNLAQPSALKKGLQNKDGWETLDPWVAAQKVQISAFDGNPRPANNNSSVVGGNYKAQMDTAQAIMKAYYGQAQAVTLPISVSGGTSPGPSTGNSNANCQTTTGGSKVDKMMQIIGKYAWPTYTPAGRSGAMDKEPAYQAAIDAAQKRGEYTGSCDGVDCGAFVMRVMRDSGADPEYNKYEGNTTQQLAYLHDYSDISGSNKIVRYHKVANSEPLQSGDIAIKDGHTYIYVGHISVLNDAGKLIPFEGDTASASQCERAPMAGPNDTRENYEWYRIIE